MKSEKGCKTLVLCPCYAHYVYVMRMLLFQKPPHTIVPVRGHFLHINMY